MDGSLSEINLLDMRIHQQIILAHHSWYITRVIGGWIYQHEKDAPGVFVPIDKETSPQQYLVMAHTV